MSTNFYWVVKTPEPATLPTGQVVNFTLSTDSPIVHIGKRFAARNGQQGFIWAGEPLQVALALAANQNNPVVEDEYGDIYTGLEMLTVIGGATVIVTDSIGKEFS